MAQRALDRLLEGTEVALRQRGATRALVTAELPPFAKAIW